MDTSPTNIHVVNLSTYEAPEIIENNRDEWVEYGEDNNYYSWLIDRYHKSPTNNAVINNMNRLIYGRGLSALNAARKPNEYASMKALFTPETLRAVISSLKMLGDAYFQVIYNKNHTKIEKVHFVTANLVRPEKCNEEGEIVGYYYSDNWEETKKFPPKRYPAFGTSKEQIEFLRVMPFNVGMKYFAPVDYQGGLPYTVLEEEIGKYLINEVTNGFSGSKVINFNNGVPDEQAQERIKAQVLSRLTGSQGEKVIVAFNDNAETQTTVEDLPLDDAPEHYSYLSKECEQKILVAHNVVSPMLIGVVTDNQGFSSNADEIEIASKYFHNIGIKPFQDLIIDCIERILAFNGVTGLDLYFSRLNMLDSVEEKEQQEEAQADSYSFAEQSFLDGLGEEEDLEGWELIDSREVDYDEEEALDGQVAEWEAELNKKTVLQKVWEFVSTGTARGNAKSSQDKEVDGFFFKVRYKYVGNANPERGFCKAMMRANKIYRKEDLEMMSQRVVNAGFGFEGADTYDVFKYKGGPRCQHKFQRLTYVSTSRGIDVKSPNAKTISTNKARKFGYNPKNPREVAMKPDDMKYKGYHPQNKNMPEDARKQNTWS